MPSSASRLHRRDPLRSFIGLLAGMLSCGLATAVLAQSSVPTLTYGPDVWYSNQQTVSGSAGKGSNEPDGNGVCNTPESGKKGANALAIDTSSSPATLAYPGGDTVAVAGGIGQLGGGGATVFTPCSQKAGTGGTGGTGSAITATFAGANPGAVYYNPTTGIILYSIGGKGGGGGDQEFGGTGGNGGAGGAGGTITLTNNVGLNIASNEANATGAFGIAVQSMGGQGGEPGNGSLLGAGGQGVPGGPGGAITITNNAPIFTNGGIAIAAQSVGGFGSNAGSSGISIFTTYNNGGGFGGNGGAVWVYNSGLLTTGSASLIDGTGNAVCSATGTLPVPANCNNNNPGSHAIYAQSIGGGGGNGGHSAGLSALGGSGGTAGDGGNVVVSNSASLAAYGLSSFGIFAQSVGGAGGNGGMAFSAGNGTASIGGSGGSGGSGAEVRVVNSGAICTGNGCIAGLDKTAVEAGAGIAIGLLAQSVGGGGGTGGFAQADSASVVAGSAFSMGGSGGSGGNGGEVAVLNTASMTTVEISSPAILAQSVGGGGGVGGGSVALSASIGKTTSISHGGSGGSGGSAGTVLVNCNNFSAGAVNYSPCAGAAAVTSTSLPSVMATTLSPQGTLISTAGLSSPGIVAQSIGGGGGAGGYAVSLSASASLFRFSVGGSEASSGSGGAGGAGGAVYASTNGTSVATLGADSPGIFAHSVGGGGGSGGLAIDATAAGLTPSLSFAFGGTAGNGGSASSVMAENTGGTIGTTGDRSPGILALSVGGGGGAGGGAISLAQGATAAMAIGVGGTGGKGGTGGVVTVFNDNYGSIGGGVGAITTNGYGSSAILAQSIGGGGGLGGSSFAGSSSLVSANDIGIGGIGGSGNTASSVSVTNYGLLTTTGGGAGALQAQSIGGGGGTGGYTLAAGVSLVGGTANVGQAGSGGAGASAGTVTVDNYGQINVCPPTSQACTAAQTQPSAPPSQTQVATILSQPMSYIALQSNAPGILAQSIGGAGGMGGFAAAGGVATLASAGVAIGGGGGSGGTGGAVAINNMGYINVAAPHSAGIEGQSVGGDGGVGGLAVSGSVALGAVLGAAVGGSAGGGGTAGNVVICTGNCDGKTSAATSYAVVTQGNQSPGIEAQSIGGHGGSGGVDVAQVIGGLAAAGITLGGEGGGGGKAGTVQVTTQQYLQTNGLLSPGIVAQSIGGNGGRGGFSASLAGSTEASFSTSIGGPGGSSGAAKDVNVTTYAPIVTLQDGSPTIVAQSIGGGGGHGGTALSQATLVAVPQFAPAVAIGAGISSAGTGGSGQNGSTVEVNSFADLYTYGHLSTAIVAQSIGGGGGNGGNSAAFTLALTPSQIVAPAVTIGGAGGAGGTGDTVSVTQAGSITTGIGLVTAGQTGSAFFSGGILGQSIGGSGGNGGTALSMAAGLITDTLAVSVGGGGSTGGNGGTVIICSNTNQTGCPSGADGPVNGVITTFGAHSSAITGQSIGGGGGNGGSAISATNKSAYSGTFSVGGFGSGGGTSGSVTISTNATLQTYGPGSAGIFAQSIGGGGGNGGSAVAGTLDIATVVQTIVNATSSSSSGLTAPSSPSTVNASSSHFGASGGAGSTSNTLGLGTATALTVGGNAGDGGTAGSVTVNSNAIISTRGALADGIFAQSVGGGGGNSGSSAADVSPSGGGTLLSAGFTLGGSGGSASNGAAVTVTSSHQIQTTGIHAAGVFAQSVGGAGGNARSASTTEAYGGPVSLSFGLGGSGGDGGMGGSVAITNSAQVATNGMGSVGLSAQSVGGGGGSANGGLSAGLAPTILSPTSSGTAASTGIVGSNGTSDTSAGANAASAGSNGSTKSGASQSAADSGFAASIQFGGANGVAGSGEGATITNTGSITTGTTNSFAGALGIAANSPAIFAQSVGGGGGNAGAGSTNANSGKSSVAMAFGGSGAGSGVGGEIAVTTSVGSLTTYDLNSAAIFAQSVGGGGGSGFSAVTNGGAVAGLSGSASVAMSLGGSLSGTSPGNTGGIVNVCVITASACSSGIGGTIVTNSDGSAGLFAQSVGGGGGAGFAASNGLVGALPVTAPGSITSSVVASTSGTSASTSSGVAFAAALGGTGSASGGGAVTVSSAASIMTLGNMAPAIQAQSVGGGGGSSGVSVTNADSGSYAASMVLGGGADANGGTVSVSHSGTIVTAGALSPGVLAQSVGGGGGTVGASSITQAGGGNTSVTMELGTAASAGGIGGSVSFAGDGGISTSGDNASAVIVQSVGGGGGIAASKNASSSSGSVGGTFKLGASGASSGSGDNGGAVDVFISSAANATANYHTSGTNSFGILAQSVGAGGGLATFVAATASSSATVSGTLGASAGGGEGGTVSLNSAAKVVTNGLQAPGLLAQSVGGGGGVLAADASGTFTGTTTLGASAASLHGPGGAVTVSTTGNITTDLNLSPGVIAQSISGGGGLSLVGASAVVLGSRATDPIATSPSAVSLINRGSIRTSGAAAIGIVAQSVGGGGGLAVSSGGTATLGGAPMGALDGGAVTVTTTGSIATSGANAIGILAQSVGGGGGTVLSTGDAVTPTFSPGDGSAGAVTVTVNAPITTTGAGAHGVIAQSVAGGGGLVMNGNTMTLQSGGGTGSSGLVTVNMNATTIASGQNSNAVVLQSTTDPILNVASGVSLIGGLGGSAVVFDGPTNILNNRGSLSTVDGSDGLAVSSLSGNTTLNNAGFILGNVGLASGADNLLHNQSTGTILAGALLDLGGTGVLRNDGLLANGRTAIGGTIIDGSMTQSASGRLVVRFDQRAGTLDTFHVTGSANIQGTIVPVLANAGQALPGVSSMPFLTADGGLSISASGLSVGGAPSAIVSYALANVGGNVSLTSTVNFAPSGLSVDNGQIGKLIGNVQASGQQHFQDLTAALVSVPTVSALNQAYWNLSGAGVSSMSTVVSQLSTSFMTLTLNPFGGSPDRNQAAQVASRRFGAAEKESLFDSARGANAAKRELVAKGAMGLVAAKPEDELVASASAQRWNVWAQAFGGRGNVAGNTSTGAGNLSASTYGFVTGFDHHLDPDTMFGFALAAGNTGFSLSNGLSGSSNVFQLGLFGSKQFGAAFVSGALSYALHDFTTTRSLQFMNGTYTAGFKAHNVGARVETGYRIASSLMGITPYAAVQGNGLFTPSYGESAMPGSSPALALGYSQRSYTELRTELGAWFDKLFDLQDDAKLAIRTRAAWAHVISNNPNVSAGFQMLPDSSFSVGGTPPVGDLAVLSAGAEYRLASGIALGAAFNGEFSGSSQSYSVNATLRFRW